MIAQALATLGRTLRTTSPPPDARASMYAMPSGAWIGSIPADVLEAFGVHTTGTVTRREALSVPAMRRGRQIICGTLGTLPLQGQRRNASGQLEPVTDGTTATLLRQLDPSTTTQWTLSWTVDDLLFSGRSWWRVLSRDAYGWPVTVERVAPHRVSIHGHQVAVDGEVQDDADVIRFDGPDQGVLLDCAYPLRTCLLLEAAVRRNSTGMPPMDILRPAEGAPGLTPEEAGELLDTWAGYRADYGTAWLNRSVEHQLVGFDPKSSQLAEARQHQALEIARMLNLDAQELNAPAASGMTYTNTEAKRRDLLDVSLHPFMAAITQRLAMPDVTPRGQTVRLDTTGFIRGTTADAVTTAVAATGGPVMTSQEAREGLLGLSGVPIQGELTQPAPAPQEVPAP